MWSEKDIKIARELNNEDTLDLLERIFVQTSTQKEVELRDKYKDITDAEYGQLMKVLHLSRLENKARLALLQNIAKKGKESKPTATAPR